MGVLFLFYTFLQEFNALMDIITCTKRSECCLHLLLSIIYTWAQCQVVLFVVCKALIIHATIVNTTRYSTAISSQQSYCRMSKIYKGLLDPAKSLTCCEAQKIMHTHCQSLVDVYELLTYVTWILLSLHDWFKGC